LADRVVIRPMQPQDRPDILAMIADLTQHEMQFEADRIASHGANVAHLNAMERATSHGQGHIVVAEDTAGARVAYATVIFREDEPFIKNAYRQYAYICDFFVDQSARSQGVGRKIFEEIQNLASLRGVQRIGIGTLARNQDAQVAYTRWGLRAYAVEYVMDMAAGPAGRDG